MHLDPNKVYQELVKAGDAWADAHAAAEMLEEVKKTVLAECGAEIDGSAAAKDHHGVMHPTYKKHVEAMVTARKVANKAKVKYDSVRTWAELLRTKAANERATLREAP